jgi:hypothetical protein
MEITYSLAILILNFPQPLPGEKGAEIAPGNPAPRHSRRTRSIVTELQKTATGACAMGDKTVGIGSKHSAEKKLSRTGDWIAPVLVWFMCIGMLLAMLSVLLGRAE